MDDPKVIIGAVLFLIFVVVGLMPKGSRHTGNYDKGKALIAGIAGIMFILLSFVIPSPARGLLITFGSILAYQVGIQATFGIGWNEVSVRQIFAGVIWAISIGVVLFVVDREAFQMGLTAFKFFWDSAIYFSRHLIEYLGTPQ